MIRALLRFLLFEIPVAIVSGFCYILFDREEIIKTTFECQRQVRKKKNLKREILIKYLNDCYNQVNESEEKGKNEKRLDKD